MLNLEDPRMDFIKSLLLVILVPLVVSSLSFASNYGGLEKTLEKVDTNQIIILNKLGRVELDVQTIKTQRESDRLTLTNVESGLNTIKSDVASMKATTDELRQDVIRGGNARIERLEDKVLQ
ncbi:hypothetical protein EniLVp02_0084 [Vibrio phage EniLVp02]